MKELSDEHKPLACHVDSGEQIVCGVWEWMVGGDPDFRALWADVACRRPAEGMTETWDGDIPTCKRCHGWLIE